MFGCTEAFYFDLVTPVSHVLLLDFVTCLKTPSPGQNIKIWFSVIVFSVNYYFVIVVYVFLAISSLIHINFILCLV